MMLKKVQKQNLLSLIGIFIIAVLMGFSVSAGNKTRIIVETDLGGDRDDQGSLVRFLLYANELDIEGIILSRAPDEFQKKQDGTHDNNAQNPSGASDSYDMAMDYLDAYGEVLSNLQVHDPDYPSVSYLKGVTFEGHDGSEDGVNHIINVLKENNPDPIWYTNWGCNDLSTSSLKRALDDIQAGTVPGITYNEAIAKLRYVEAYTQNHLGDTHTGNLSFYMDTFFPDMDGVWYTRWNDNTDIEDWLWANAQSTLCDTYYTGGREQDTMAYMHLLPNGLNIVGKPQYGGWSGRYGWNSTESMWWCNQKDFWEGTTTRDNTLLRWGGGSKAEEIMNDFKARAKWCDISNYGDANHHPEVVLNGDTGFDPVYIPASPGQDISLSAASTSDPDGDTLSYLWDYYKEASEYGGSVSITNTTQENCTVHVPNDFTTGDTIHVILRVTDDGIIPLTRYKRAIIEFSGTPINQAPTVNAGSDQSITLPTDIVNLDGTVTDDGLPAGATVTTLWSVFSGPGTVIFGDDTAVDTTAQFSIEGTYVLRLTADDTDLHSSDDVTITVNAAPVNLPPTVNAGSKQSITLPTDIVNLDGTVSDDGLPGATVTTLWTKVSGPGTVTFGDDTAVDTTAQFSIEGTYVLRLTADDTDLQSSDDVSITVNPEGAASGDLKVHLLMDNGSGTAASDSSSYNNNGTLINGASWSTDTKTGSGYAISLDGSDDYINVGNDASLNDSDTITLSFWVKAPASTPNGRSLISKHISPYSGDGFQIAHSGNGTLRLTVQTSAGNSIVEMSGVLDNTWRHVAFTIGGGTVKSYLDGALQKTSSYNQGNGFGNTEDLHLGARGEPSQYFPGLLDNFRFYSEVLDDTAIAAVYNEDMSGEPINLAPTVNAGSDQSTTLPTDIVNLDGTVSDDGLPGATVTTLWTKVSGPGTVTFGDDTAVDTTAQFSIDGTYVLRLTADDTDLQSSDDVSITVNPEGAASGDLKVHLLMDAGSGTTASDSSSYNNNGTLINGASWSTDTKTGSGYAINLDGSDDYINVGNDASLNDSDTITLSFWVKAPSSTPNGRSLISKHISPYSGDGFQIAHSGNGTLRLTVQTSAGNSIVEMSGVLDNTWRHVAFTIGGGTVKSYLDGALQRTSSYNHGNGFGNTEDLHLGARGEPSQYFPGLLDNFRFYSEVLDDAAIGEIYNDEQ